jgi:hypothetical protein
MLAFELTARRSVHIWDREVAPAAGRAVAVLSLAIWIGVIFLGRWVGFTTSSLPAPAGDEIDFDKLEELLPK